MAWDSSRQVPWKKLGTYLLLYAVIILVILAVTQRGKSLSSFAPSLIFGVVVACLLFVVLIKFGYKMPFLRSREELQDAREARAMARRMRTGGGSSRSSGSRSSSSRSSSGSSAQSYEDGPRPKAAPTSRTSTGRTQHPRRTTKTRKR